MPFTNVATLASRGHGLPRLDLPLSPPRESGGLRPSTEYSGSQAAGRPRPGPNGPPGFPWFSGDSCSGGSQTLSRKCDPCDRRAGEATCGPVSNHLVLTFTSQTPSPGLRSQGISCPLGRVSAPAQFCPLLMGPRQSQPSRPLFPIQVVNLPKANLLIRIV